MKLGYLTLDACLEILVDYLMMTPVYLHVTCSVLPYAQLLLSLGFFKTKCNR